MQILPSGLVLPPLPYAVALAVATLAVAGWLSVHVTAVTERQVVALAPWMVAGAVAHVLYVIGGLPAAVRPLAGAPTVYATVSLLAGTTWLGADTAGRDATRVVGTTGLAAAGPVLAVTLAVGAREGLSPFWPGVGLVVAVVVAAVAWAGLRRLRPGVTATGRVGPLTVFAHALDGVSTAVGVDALSYGERTPLSRLIIETGRALPTVELLGAGWLFVLVKLAVAVLVVVAVADVVREEPAEGNALLALVAAVGLGPGAHNLVLFTIA
jgi:uncharacterized membrane protein